MSLSLHMCSLKADPVTSVARGNVYISGCCWLLKQNTGVHLRWVGGADTLTGSSLSVNVAAQVSQMRKV